MSEKKENNKPELDNVYGGFGEADLELLKDFEYALHNPRKFTRCGSTEEKRFLQLRSILLHTNIGNVSPGIINFFGGPNRFLDWQANGGIFVDYDSDSDSDLD